MDVQLQHAINPKMRFARFYGKDHCFGQRVKLANFIEAELLQFDGNGVSKLTNIAVEDFYQVYFA